MTNQKVSNRKANSICFALFLFGLAVTTFFDLWWPGIMLALGIPLALRQILLGRNYDALITLVLFVGTYIFARMDVAWDMLLTILFTIGGIYILCRESLDATTRTEEEEEEDIVHEIEEEK